LVKLFFKNKKIKNQNKQFH